MAKSNAERQAAYRRRRAQGSNAPVTPADRDDAGVTVECSRHVYIGRGVHEDVYAVIAHTPPCRAGSCQHCDQEREWYRVRGQDRTRDGFPI